jgi:DNA-binding transcriptional ArsR family regulator
MELKIAIEMLSGLAQATRLGIFRLLVQAGPEGLCVSDIGSALDAAPATLSFHLTHLRHAGLIHSRRDGRMIFYSADYDAMNALMAYLLENCCQGEAGCATKTVCQPGIEENKQ